MKRFFSVVLTITFLVSGCSNNQSVTNVPIEPLPSATPTEITVTPSYTETATQTPIPTSTSTPAITSTFDLATIITRTPSTAAQCPQVTDTQVPKFPQPDLSTLTFRDHEKTSLDYLNQGGDPELLIKALVNTGWLKYTEDSIQIKDITGDGIPEVIVSPSETYVFGCNNEKYGILLRIDNEGVAINFERNQIVAVEDMNLNGTSELVIATYGCGGMGEGMCLDGWIYEWDSNSFNIKSEVSMVGRQISGAQPLMEVTNINNDQLLELNVTGGISTGSEYYYLYPWRQQTDTYVWNGENFVLQNTTLSNPQFHYQVVQDADRAVLEGQYDNALKLYQNAIYGNYDWFSEERKQYIVDNASGISSTEPDPDLNEQTNLVGYSFFRIITTYVLQGNMDEAQIAYDRIHKNFAKGFPGYDYVIMADSFWNEYQSSQDLEKACAKAIEYVLKNPSILKYFGSDYHNTFQDNIYEPTDICPLKK